MPGSEERRRRYADLSARLQRLDDRSLAELVGRSGRSAWGWSGTRALEDGTPVFVKRVPITSLEARHRHSTKNRFQLPAVYNYGVGSAGFGVHRELATHVRTTGWVLADETDAFPLLLHARVLPRRPKGPDRWLGGDDYVRSWNGSRRIGRFIEARAAATEELCLVLEHVPWSLRDWLADHPEHVRPLLGRLCDAITVLHDHGVLHLDAHYGNVVTDGDRLCLTDFGLALDAAFDLAPAERAFFEAHQHYDVGEALANLGSLVVVLVDRTPPATQAEIAAVAGLQPGARRARAVSRALPRIIDAGLLEVHPDVAALVARYVEVIDAMWTFFDAMQANPRKDTPFDDARVAALVADAGGPPTSTA